MLARRRWLVTGDTEILLSVFPHCTVWQRIAPQYPPRCSFLAIDLNIFRNAGIAEGAPGLTKARLVRRSVVLGHPIRYASRDPADAQARVILLT